MNDINYRIEEVPKGTIKRGDTILHNGKLRTVGTFDITRCLFMGLMIFGDNYKNGYELVKKAIIEKSEYPIIWLDEQPPKEGNHE